MDKYTTTLKMLPVCECGHIFEDGIVLYKDIAEINNLKHAINRIDPPYCPSCKRKIECIEHYSYQVEETRF